MHYIVSGLYLPRRWTRLGRRREESCAPSPGDEGLSIFRSIHCLPQLNLLARRRTLAARQIPRRIAPRISAAAAAADVAVAGGELPLRTRSPRLPVRRCV